MNRSLYSITGDIRDFNTILINREELRGFLRELLDAMISGDIDGDAWHQGWATLYVQTEQLLKEAG